MTLPPRSSRTCRHVVPIGGVAHEVQSQLIEGTPARVDSRVSIGGQVVVRRSVSLDTMETPVDPVAVTQLLEERQKSAIRRLVEARRAELATQDPSGPVRSVPRDFDRGQSGARGPEEARLRRQMVRFARGVARLAKGGFSPSDKLQSLIRESTILLSGEDHRSRSREMAELHLLRAEAEKCLADEADEEVRELLVREFARMAADFRKINDRATLRAFDLSILERVERTLERSSDNAALGEEIEQALHLTWGRDRQLDDQMAMHSDLCVGDIRLPLRRTLDRLRREIAAD